MDDTSDDENYEDAIMTEDDDDVMSKRTNRSVSGSNTKKRKVNNSEPAQGSKASRPIGMKKAKKLAKLEAERSRSIPFAAAGVVEANGIATMTKELVGCCPQGKCNYEAAGRRRSSTQKIDEDG